jgi:hypothetical protein
VLKGIIKDAREINLPAMKNFAEGERLADFILEGKMVPEPPLSELKGVWVQKLMNQLLGVKNRCFRLHFKSVGGILAMQEKIAAAWIAARRPVDTGVESLVAGEEGSEFDAEDVHTVVIPPTARTADNIPSRCGIPKGMLFEKLWVEGDPQGYDNVTGGAQMAAAVPAIPAEVVEVLEAEEVLEAAEVIEAEMLPAEVVPAEPVVPAIAAFSSTPNTAKPAKPTPPPPVVPAAEVFDAVEVVEEPAADASPFSFDDAAKPKPKLVTPTQAKAPPASPPPAAPANPFAFEDAPSPTASGDIFSLDADEIKQAQAKKPTTPAAKPAAPTQPALTVSGDDAAPALGAPAPAVKPAAVLSGSRPGLGSGTTTIAANGNRPAVKITLVKPGEKSPFAK